MSVTLGAYTFGCGNFHEAAPVEPAPVRERKIEIFGLNGIGTVYGGQRGRMIPIRCSYLNFASRGALQVGLGLDDGQKTDRGLYLLDVDGATFSNVIFQGLRAGDIFFDALTGTWCALNCELLFEALLA